MRNAATGAFLNTVGNVTFTSDDTHAYLVIVGGERMWFPATTAEAAELEENGETVVAVVAC